MKWPFVRKSKYVYLTKCLDAKNDVIANQMDNINAQFNEINRLNQELASELNSHRETKECFKYTTDGLRIHNENIEKELEEEKSCNVILDEINIRLKKELEETKKLSQQRLDAYNTLNHKSRCLEKEIEETKEKFVNAVSLLEYCHKIFLNTEKELEETKDALKIAQEDLKETKDHEQKLFEAHDKLNQQNIGLLYENEKLLKQINQLIFDKSHLKTKVKKLESKLVYFDAEYTIMKKNADWFYGNYCRFKDMIEKSGYFPGK